MPTLGVVFPGQGSQSVGMGVDVAEAFGPSAQCFERASRIVGYDMLELCRNGTDEQLRETRVSQPAIFTANMAIYKAVETLGATAIVSAGHSFGEYCSLTIAGSLDFDAALRLVNERGLAMGAAADEAPGAMAAIIGFDQPRVEAMCAQARAESGARVDIANLNAPIQIVVSGDVAGVNALCDIAKNAGAKRVVVLNVSGAWHSELMRSAVARFAPFVESAHLEAPSFEVISNVEVRPYESVGQIRSCLIASLVSRVRWHETAEALAARRPDFIVECGASAVLAPMMRRIAGVTADRVAHVSDRESLGKLEQSMRRAAADASHPAQAPAT
ncbi:MAG: ACP S-malonyltransferase [Candidatus Eremiobacteraeota bacterium]|nr:ACP S-malonyltransferase [Candidatus Eremiobacteraeota bacterium]MBV8366634.1 ACP S-malonyltransferase [Candidatus Eremiobacteraeota bacterium]